MKFYDSNLFVLIPTAMVFVWQTVRATTTFRMIRGDWVCYASSLLPLAYIAILIRGMNAPLSIWRTVPGMFGLAAALILFEWSRNTVRGQLFSYAFSTDLPRHMCSNGPFAYIRNPFYTSYILATVSAALMLPDIVTLIVIVLMIQMLMAAARQEEAKFEQSPLSDEFVRYKRRTGRFGPPIRRL